MSINKSTLLILTGVVILGGIVLFGRPGAAPQEVMCTMDALVCPDGSGVGREGPQCTFQSCPNKDFFVGRLDRTGDSYRLLLIDSPIPGEGSSYVIPLELQTTNVVGQLLGQTVRVKGSFAAGNRLRVTSVEELTPEESGEPDMITVGIGVEGTKSVNGVAITLHSVVADYRCPVDVQCIEAGAIVAHVTFAAGAQQKTFNMPSDEVPQSFAGRKISIVNVAPSRISAREPDPSSYRVTFKVER